METALDCKTGEGLSAGQLGKGCVGVVGGGGWREGREREGTGEEAWHSSRELTANGQHLEMLKI